MVSKALKTAAHGFFQIASARRMSAPRKLLFQQPASLRRQLLYWLLIPLTLLLVVNSVMTYYNATNSANMAYDRSLLGSALAIAERIGVVDGQLVVDLPHVALEMLESDAHDRIYYKVIAPTGELITGYPGVPSPPGQDALPGKAIFYNDFYRGEEIRIAAVYQSIYDPAASGAVLVQVGETLLKRKMLAHEILLDAVLRQLLLILLAAGVVWLAIHRGLRPLSRFRREIAGRGERDLSPVREDAVPLEVRPLTQAMNQLIGRSRAALAAQQQFIADASHQLRTPLTVLKTQSEVALRQTDFASMRSALQQLHASTREAAHLAGQLLSLARSEAGANRLLALVPVDLNTLARELTSEWVPRALAKDIDLGFESRNGAVVIAGDAHLLHELLVNLLDNAVRYTRPGGWITVSVDRDAETAVLSVADNGPGIPAEERQRVFERFYRVLGNTEEGCGLGLAIVREIAAAHGAEIRLEPTAGEAGLRVRVCFPPPTPPD